MDIERRKSAREFPLSQAREMLRTLLDNPRNSNRESIIEALIVVMSSNQLTLDDLIEYPMVYIPFDLRQQIKIPDEAVS